MARRVALDIGPADPSVAREVATRALALELGRDGEVDMLAGQSGAAGGLFPDTVRPPAAAVAVAS